jgi:hypothetical protein
MIVLDEHLTDARVETAIARWYKGKIAFIKKLRQGTIIKDDVIPTLLRQLQKPTFVTIDWRDFWRRASADSNYCIICFTLDLDSVDQISPLLRRVLNLAPFKTKSDRMGKVIRVTKNSIRYSCKNDSRIYYISNF